MRGVDTSLEWDEETDGLTVGWVRRVVASADRVDSDNDAILPSGNIRSARVVGQCYYGEPRGKEHPSVSQQY